MSKNYYLHLEGMDLAGKTTIAKLIVKNSGLDWIIYNSCLSQKNPIQELIKILLKQNVYDDEIYGYLLFVALMIDIKVFKSNKNVIQDSALLLRSIVYHKEAKHYTLVKLFEGIVERHPVPDISIYLTASIDVRRRRLMKRMQEDSKEVTSNDKMILNNPEKFVKMDNCLMELSKKIFNSIVIDTSEMTEIQTLDYITYLLHCNDLCK